MKTEGTMKTERLFDILLDGRVWLNVWATDAAPAMEQLPAFYHGRAVARISEDAEAAERPV